MRFVLVSEPGELPGKTDQLVEALSDQLYAVGIDLHQELEKAHQHRQPNLKFRVLRDLKKITGDEYEKTIKRMVDEIGKVLDQGVQKSDDTQTTLTKANNTPKQRTDPKVNKQEAAYQKVPGARYTCSECEYWSPSTSANPHRCTLHRQSEGNFAPNGRCKFWKQGEPVYGKSYKNSGYTKDESRYLENPTHTGFRCNRCQHWVGAGNCEVVKGKVDLTGSCSLWESSAHEKPFNKSKQKAPVLAEAVQDTVDRSDAAYKRIKTILKRKGYLESDFESGGPLYGYSTNQLIGMVKQS